MLDDRDYMRQPVYRDRPQVPPMSFTIALLIVNAVVFLVECAVYGYPLRFPVNPADSYFALSVEGLEHGYVWQLLTYQFMHAGVLHILLNGWVIYVFGQALEQTLGGKKFLTLFLAGGVVGGLCQALAALLWPGYFGGPVVGASAGAFGLVAAYAVLFPERELTLLLFFIIPLRLTARMLLVFSAVLAEPWPRLGCYVSRQPHRARRASGRNVDRRDFHPPVRSGPRMAVAVSRAPRRPARARERARGPIRRVAPFRRQIG